MRIKKLGKRREGLDKLLHPQLTGCWQAMEPVWNGATKQPVTMEPAVDGAMKQTMEPAWEGATKEAVSMYMREMEKVLPEANDDTLLQLHDEFKRKTIRNFLERTEHLAEGTDSTQKISTAIDAKFLDVLDSNWQKCESFCREVLNNLKFATSTTAVPSFLPKSEACQTLWWNCIKNLRTKYLQSVGESMCYQMPHVWLEYLNERQEHDFKVILGDIVSEREKIEEMEDVDSGISNPSEENDDTDFEYQPLPTGDVDPKNEKEPYSDFCLETTDKQLRLQMTWGRVFVFWKYWVECRKDTSEILERILNIIEEIEENGSEATGTMRNKDLVELIYQRIVQIPQYRIIPLVFARSLSKDFLTYRCLMRKLREFFDMLLTPDFVCAFDMNPANIFEQISRFKSDMKTKSIDRDNSGFRLCAKFLEKEEDKSNLIARFFLDSPKPLLHLRTFLYEIAAKTQVGDNISFTFRRSLLRLIEDERNWSEMLSEGIEALLVVAANVSDAIPQLRRDIVHWSPQRDETIGQLRPIIKKLHETTKNVAITQTVSSSVGIVGGAIAIGGLIMAPFTLGASLIPTAIAGGVVSGVSAATAIGAAVTEVIIDKDEMKKATACLEQDKMLFQGVANLIKYLNINSCLLLRYIPQDELESFIGVITDPKSKVMRSISSAPKGNPKIALNIAGLVSFGGKAVLIPVSRLVLAGTIAASRVAVLALAHGVAAIGVALDVANLVLAGVKLGKGARSQSAERLEEIVTRLEEEKQIMDNCLNDISLEF